MTSTTSSNLLASSPDYNVLMSEITTTINKNNNLFKLIQKANYPDAGSYSSDLLNYKIDTQITDLKKARSQIWDFLQKKYEENTKLRTFYFTEIRKVDNHIADLDVQKQDLIDSIENNDLKTNTSIKAIQNEKYNLNKMVYYLFLYKVLIFVQILILAVITLCILNIIPKATCLIITLIILIATIAFVAYYVFFINIGRNKFSWSKFDHDNNASSPAAGQCIDSTNLTQDDKAKAIVDTKISEMIKLNKTTNTCST